MKRTTLKAMKELVKEGKAVDFNKGIKPDGVGITLKAISIGKCGRNGALFIGTDGKYYAITERNVLLYKLIH